MVFQKILMMTGLCLSPHCMQITNERSPCRTMKRKNLFPSDSPQSLGLGYISSLTSSPEVYSPPNWTDSSENNSRHSVVLTEIKFDDILYDTGKHMKIITKSTHHSLEKEDDFEDILGGLVSPGNVRTCSEFKLSLIHI